MYNSIYPVNINYHKNGSYRYNKDNEPSDNNVANNNQNTFPNGNKVSIDYTKGQINISQVVNDFKNTIVAINAPKDVADEVYLYLGLVERESLKEVPSKEIILSNLRNASKISDAYIAKSLNKPSNVVEGWIDALFLQKINLKSDPTEINPDFLLEFPQKAQDKIDEANSAPISKQNQEETLQQEVQNEPVKFLSVSNPVYESSEADVPVESEEAEEAAYVIKNSSKEEVIEQESDFELSSDEPKVTVHTSTSLYSPNNETDKKARSLFIKAKQEPNTNAGDTNAINLLNEALGILSNQEGSNDNIKAAIHFERGKIFDDYDYVDYALRDYWEATKSEDLNLKAQAFYKSARIYDEFKEFAPALDNYLSTVAYSGEAGNYTAQTLALNDIASLYASQFDSKNSSQYSNLALQIAQSSDDTDLVAKAYSNSAQNYQYLGENEKALNSYKNALQIFSRSDETFEETAHNYEQASIVMRKLGNNAKADKLLLKANLYYQKAQQQQAQLEEAS